MSKENIIRCDGPDCDTWAKEGWAKWIRVYDDISGDEIKYFHSHDCELRAAAKFQPSGLGRTGEE
jgi:hypothetical protein